MNWIELALGTFVVAIVFFGLGFYTGYSAGFLRGTSDAFETKVSAIKRSVKSNENRR